jgi:HTH-type transcriptional regulator/antitoxin HipB
MPTDTRTTAENLGEMVRRSRKALGLNQQGLALVADVSRRTVYAIEHGKPTVRLDALVRVLSALGLELVAIQRRGRRRERP